MEIHTNYYSLIPYSNLLYIKSFLAWDDRVAMNYAKDLKTLIPNHYQEK